MIVWKNDSDTIILKPIEIRSKRGVKKMKKTNSAIYIPNMDAKEFEKICVEKGLQFIYTQVQPHGRLIDGDALVDKHFGKEFLSKVMTADEDDLGTALVNIPLVINNAPTIIQAEPSKEE